LFDKVNAGVVFYAPPNLSEQTTPNLSGFQGPLPELQIFPPESHVLHAPSPTSHNPGHTPEGDKNMIPFPPHLLQTNSAQNLDLLHQALK
jgi:hypothetical protein